MLFWLSLLLLLFALSSILIDDDYKKKKKLYGKLNSDGLYPVRVISIVVLWLSDGLMSTACCNLS